MKGRITVTTRFIRKFGNADAYNQIRWIKEGAISGRDVIRKLEQLLHHKPLQYVIGNQPFINTVIECKPPTLIPRPETEFWVDALIARFHHTSGHTVLDLCTGSGCIAVNIAKEMECDKVVAIDNSVAACNLASLNAHKNLNQQQLSKLEIRRLDILKDHIDLSSFNIITMNPPYITLADYQGLESTVREWEDKDALVPYSDSSGLVFYERLLQLLKGAQNKQVWMEIGYNQTKQVVQLAKESGVHSIELLQDPFNPDINRVVILHL
ncbi:hypothetical protein E3P99_01001 [Wallemia hederae]|uniref:peptide chain release factor N(5)-glutamine methyltransferase n=1 Tax=Wallemia hederae TaxID=1540922 RepID=A0A4T0FS19_9BASI|nr:hypothetical protein E3P99_01001 [Wallemia hederae]